jgi:adenosylcobinamide-phosphate synthase
MSRGQCSVLCQMISILSVLLALALDKLLGEPRRFHPLVGFGNLVNALERIFYADSKLRGALVLLGLLIPPTLLLIAIESWVNHWTVGVVILYLALGWQSLLLHAQRVHDALSESDIELARQNLGELVSRETAKLDEQGVAKGAIESVLENGNDAIFAVIFWFVVAGAPGVFVYRLVNTLDAMWGYRNARYIRFGWAAARCDDVLNYVPARLTALGYALAGRFERAIHCWKTQGLIWKSPNAGPVMAAGAGSLGVLLGGPEVYQGQLQARIVLGEGRTPDAQAIVEAGNLIGRTLLIWIGVLFAGVWLIGR